MQGDDVAHRGGTDATDSSDGQQRPSVLRRFVGTLRRHLLLTSSVMLLLPLGAGGFIWYQLHRLSTGPYSRVSYTVPEAERLAARVGEKVYRIDASQSNATYRVSEKFLGATAQRATGSTNGIAGDLALNAKHPSASRVGEIVVNLEELHSDNSLRDARIRADFLESHANPLARFRTTQLSGLPATLHDGRNYQFTMHGKLTIKDITAPVAWRVDAKIHDGRVTAKATTRLKLSTFKVGPISIAGLVSTGDDVDMTLTLVALDPSSFTVPDQIAVPVSQRHGKGPSFKSVVMPVLERSCASCHAAGQVGAEHWKLETAADAAKVADGLGVVVKTKYMPPWPSSGPGVPLAHSKALDQATINELVKWADTGGKLDVPTSTRIRPAKEAAGPQPRKDIVLKMPKAYLGSTKVPNDYRCFVLDPHFTKPTYVTGYTVTPDKVQEIHHAQVFHIPADGMAREAAKEGRDGQPGSSCYSGPSLGFGTGGRGGSRHGRGQRGAAARDRHVGSAAATPRVSTGKRPSVIRTFTGQAGLVAGWVPGQDPVVYPRKSGILFQPGDGLVLQIHYHYTEKPTPDRSILSLQTEPGAAHLRDLMVVNPLAPVEIPCSPGVKAKLCDRNAALADDGRLYGSFGTLVEPGLLGICGKNPADLTKNFNGIAHSSCDSKVPATGTIVAAMGHMHTLGKSFKLTIDPESTKPKTLVNIPTWNFDWQMNYELAKPIHVTAGDTVRIECSWDRSLDPNRAPKYIVFAEGTEDEMCFATYALIPDPGVTP